MRHDPTHQQLEPHHRHETLSFPRGFLWGTSSSAYQVEGNCRNADWWSWERLEAGRKRSGQAIDHYHRYAEDFEVLGLMHQNAYRLGVEWSRLEPAPGAWDQAEANHYKDVLKRLEAHGVKVFLTLHHFTLPSWVASRGGWESAQTVQLYVQFVERCVKIFGSRVYAWLTINEPMVYLSQTRITGAWPPQKKSYWQAWRVFRHLSQAHRSAYERIHALIDGPNKKAKVGIPHSVISFVAYDTHSLKHFVQLRLADTLWNHLFYRWTRGSHDFLGINYYIHQRIKRTSTFNNLFVDIHEENRDRSDIGWEVYPQGLFDVLVDVSEYKLPIYVTENGIATINDDRRARFLVSYLKECYHAIRSGVDLRGYFYWSLFDNYEWDKGYGPRFGLIDVNYRTLQRRLRPSAWLYGHIAHSNGLPHDVLRFIGHGARPESPAAWGSGNSLASEFHI